MIKNECPKCGQKLKITNKVIANYLQCENENCCFEEISYPDQCCLYQRLEPKRCYNDTVSAMLNYDDYNVYNQCMSCGRRVGDAIDKSKFSKSSLELFDNSLLENRKLIESELSKLSEEINKRANSNDRNKFGNDYEIYLKSDRWKKIKEFVFARDNHLCQSCLTNPATQIHHTEAKYRKNEPLFTLVSVCDKCHRIITQMDRGNYNNLEVIKYKFDANTI